MRKDEGLSEELLDFLHEMMNIGAGNAATALSQMLQSRVDMNIPRVHVVPAPNATSVLDDPCLPAACVRMGMVGDVMGGIFFVVPDEQKMSLIHLAKRAMLGSIALDSDHNDSVLMEIGNIIAGVYLEAIYDFCNLKIYHTVPEIAVDMIQAVLDESLAVLSREAQEIIMVENVFIAGADHIKTFFLIAPDGKSVDKLFDSIEDARAAYA